MISCCQHNSDYRNPIERDILNDVFEHYLLLNNVVYRRFLQTDVRHLFRNYEITLLYQDCRVA